MVDGDDALLVDGLRWNFSGRGSPSGFAAADWSGPDRDIVTAMLHGYHKTLAICILHFTLNYIFSLFFLYFVKLYMIGTVYGHSQSTNPFGLLRGIAPGTA